MVKSVSSLICMALLFLCCCCNLTQLLASAGALSAPMTGRAFSATSIGSSVTITEDTNTIKSVLNETDELNLETSKSLWERLHINANKTSKFQTWYLVKSSIHEAKNIHFEVKLTMHAEKNKMIQCLIILSNKLMFSMLGNTASKVESLGSDTRTDIQFLERTKVEPSTSYIQSIELILSRMISNATVVFDDKLGLLTFISSAGSIQFADGWTTVYTITASNIVENPLAPQPKLIIVALENQTQNIYVQSAIKTVMFTAHKPSDGLVIEESSYSKKLTKSAFDNDGVELVSNVLRMATDLYVSSYGSYLKLIISSSHFKKTISFKSQNAQRYTMLWMADTKKFIKEANALIPPLITFQMLADKYRNTKISFAVVNVMETILMNQNNGSWKAGPINLTGVEERLPAIAGFQQKISDFIKSVTKVSINSDDICMLSSEKHPDMLLMQRYSNHLKAPIISSVSFTGEADATIRERVLNTTKTGELLKWMSLWKFLFEEGTKESVWYLVKSSLGEAKDIELEVNLNMQNREIKLDYAERYGAIVPGKKCTVTLDNELTFNISGDTASEVKSSRLKARSHIKPIEQALSRIISNATVVFDYDLRLMTFINSAGSLQFAAESTTVFTVTVYRNTTGPAKELLALTQQPKLITATLGDQILYIDVMSEIKTIVFTAEETPDGFVIKKFEESESFQNVSQLDRDNDAVDLIDNVLSTATCATWSSYGSYIEWVIESSNLGITMILKSQNARQYKTYWTTEIMGPQLIQMFSDTRGDIKISFLVMNVMETIFVNQGNGTVVASPFLTGQKMLLKQKVSDFFNSVSKVSTQNDTCTLVSAEEPNSLQLQRFFHTTIANVRQKQKKTQNDLTRIIWTEPEISN